MRCGPFDRNGVAYEEIRPYPGPVKVLIFFLLVALSWLVVIAVGKGFWDLAMALRELG